MGETGGDLTTEVTVAEDRQTPLRTWAICGLMLLATMLNYMDRQTLAQQAADIRGELRLSNEGYGWLETGFGLAFAVGSLVTGAIADRVSLRLALPRDLAGLVGGRISDRLGEAITPSSSFAGSCWASSRPGSGPAHWRPRNDCCLATSVRWATASSRVAHRSARSSRHPSSCS